MDWKESDMCGIVGVASRHGKPIAANLLDRMTDALAHRGPDSRGVYRDGAVGLGHRRLAIIDLTASGHQPMANETDDVLVTYNGEIYNFQPLRTELIARGHRFHSQTDTEVVVHAYEEWGEACVERFNGMFAFAIWDRPRRRLFLARDRYGIKPLYWYFQNELFIFASEIKAILEHPDVVRRVCYPALNEYFSFQNIFSDLTLFDGIRILPPATTLRLDLVGTAPPYVHTYWDYPIGRDKVNASEEDCIEQVRQLFVRAVAQQLMSDVPVGSFLSGGIDSGSITCVAASHLDRLTTFTGGFDLSSASGLELGFDERRSAEMLANQFKTEHYEVVMHAGDMEWALPRLIWHLEDLRVGQSYPNYYVSRLASKFVKVCLSGVGGDELFGGYPWRYYRGLNSPSPEDYFQRYYQFWQRLVPDHEKGSLFNAETRRQLGDHSSFEVFRQVFQSYPGTFHDNEDFINASLYFELKTFLHGVLVIEDKISMAHSLETRVPFLDNDLVEFATRLPAQYKLRNLEKTIRVDENTPGKRHLYEVQTSEGKAILRQALSCHVPPEILARTKQGFSAPDASWFRGESIDYINRLLRDSRARIYEFINPAYVGRVLDQHCSGQTNMRLLIWSLLSFEWWLRNYMSGAVAVPAPLPRAA
jgi:asparagine synthase (glutamine-hydrolysing)